MNFLNKFSGGVKDEVNKCRKEVENSVSQNEAKLKAGIGGVQKSVAGNIESSTARGEAMLKSGVGGVQKTIDSSVESATTRGDAMMKSGVAGVNKVVGDIESTATRGEATIKSGIDGVQKTVAANIESTTARGETLLKSGIDSAQKVKGDIESTATQGGAYLKSSIDGVQKTVSNTIESTTTRSETLLKSGIDSVQKVKGDIESTATQGEAYLKSSIDGVQRTVSNTIESTTTRGGAFLQSSIDGVQKTVSDTIESTTTRGEAFLKSSIGGVQKTVSDTIQSTTTRGEAFLKSTIGGVQKSVDDTVQNTTSSFSDGLLKAGIGGMQKMIGGNMESLTKAGGQALLQAGIGAVQKMVGENISSTYIQGLLQAGIEGLQRMFGSTKKCPFPERMVSAASLERKNPFAGLALQKYEEILAKCLADGTKFEDPEFEAVDSSVFFSKKPPRPFEWRRPHEICENPEWITAGASRFDVRQGELGDCWLLAAVASLTCNEKLFNFVVEPHQSFTNNYCGIFKFNFWHQGEWQEVVVDDRLPTYRNQLVFMHSTEKNEFWSALLEKAYAKLVGSYESLKGGSTSEAMEDFTGGVTEMFDLKSAPPNLLNIMLKACQRGSLMGCSIDAVPGQTEAELSNGLICGHAYSVTGVQLADIKTAKVQGQIPMVRIRNPWGNGSEWKGAWSDGSKEWTLLSDSEKKELGLNFEDDGEFWMSFQDFKGNFHKLEICNLGPDSLDEDDLQNKKKWETFKEHGNWIRRVNAGGCRNYIDTFWTNPQFRMTLTDPDDDDDDDQCTALVAVLQKDRRKKRKEGLDLLTIGYVIYKLTDPNSGPLDVNFFKYNASVAKSPTFINMREICGRHKLPPGTYVIVPSTFEPHYEGEFLMRIFTEKANVSGEIDEQTGLDDDAFKTPPSIPRGLPAKNAPKKRRERPEPTEQERNQADVLKQSFRKIAGEDMEVDAYELQEILNSVFTKEFSFSGFGIDCARSMVAMHDGDLSGKLGYEEFKELWDDLRRWKGVFKEFDRDQSGNLSSYELRNALNHVGFHISNGTFKSLVMRYSNKSGQIDFGDFIMCAVRLKTMLTSFRGHDPQNSGFAPYDIDSFIQTTLYS